MLLFNFEAALNLYVVCFLTCWSRVHVSYKCLDISVRYLTSKNSALIPRTCRQLWNEITLRNNEHTQLVQKLIYKKIQYKWIETHMIKIASEVELSIVSCKRSMQSDSSSVKFATRKGLCQFNDRNGRTEYHWQT